MAGKQTGFWKQYEPVLRRLASEGLTDQEILASGEIPVTTVMQIITARNRYGIPGGETQRTRTPQPPAEKPDPTNAEIAKLEQERIRLADELAHTGKKLKAIQRENALFEALAEVVRTSTQPLPPSPQLRIGTKEKATPCDAVVVLSDEHADEVIHAAGTWGLEQYDFNIFRCRLHRWVEIITKYVGVHLPKHQFERLWVFKLGDSVQGDIHGHGPRNHFGNTLKAAIAVGDAEAQAIQALIPLFPGGVHVVGVSGNHPRRSAKKDYDGPHDNFDYLVTTQIATRLSHEIDAGRLTVHAPESWTAYVDVRGKLWALNHGDDVKGFAGHPWYGFSRKNGRVQALVARADQRVRYFVYGHFHTSVEMQEADAESLHSGNWSLTDSFAQNALSVGSEPVQPLYVVDDDYGIILKVPIYVRNLDAEQRYREGEWEPAFGSPTVLDRITPQTQGFPVIAA